MGEDPIPVKSAEHSRGLSTSLTSPTFVLLSSSWHGSGMMLLHEDMPFPWHLWFSSGGFAVLMSSKFYLRGQLAELCGDSLYIILVSVVHG